MALAEPQIVRYARQILLRGVGGVGQRSLLETGVEARGTGAALFTAVAYVAGGGSPVRLEDRPVRQEEAGYLLHASDAGRPLLEVLRKALYAENPDAGRTPTSEILLAEGAVGEASGAQIHLGGVDGEGRVVFAAASTCRGCVAGAVATLGPTPPGLVDLVGSLGALVHQRGALGLKEREAGVITVSASGEIRTDPLPDCGAHR